MEPFFHTVPRLCSCDTIRIIIATKQQRCRASACAARCTHERKLPAYLLCIGFEFCFSESKGALEFSIALGVGTHRASLCGVCACLLLKHLICLCACSHWIDWSGAFHKEAALVELAYSFRSSLSSAFVVAPMQ